jgi:hypothetical protein
MYDNSYFNGVIIPVYYKMDWNKNKENKRQI